MVLVQRASPSPWNSGGWPEPVPAKPPPSVQFGEVKVTQLESALEVRKRLA